VERLLNKCCQDEIDEIDDGNGPIYYENDDQSIEIELVNQNLIVNDEQSKKFQQRSLILLIFNLFIFFVY